MTKVKSAFTKNNIEIPYPQMVLHNPEKPAPEERDDKP
jgi:small-conductance mechanosensitive channel